MQPRRMNKHQENETIDITISCDTAFDSIL